MLYQCNVIISISIAAFAFVFLTHHVILNKDNIFFWMEECEEGFDCTTFYFTGPPNPVNNEFTSMLKELYLVPPPGDPDKSEFDIDLPVWRKLVDWNKVQASLIEVYKDRPPGFFVEVGAVDGDFMSQTIHIERNLSWTGLLIEPDPRAFNELVKMKRNAWLSPLCVIHGFPMSKKYWLRRLEEDLPHHFVQLLMARSKLEAEILEGDEGRGSSISVPCTSLRSVLKAINVKEVDLLTINTGGEDDISKIHDVIRNRKITVKALLLHFQTAQLYSEPFPKVRGYIVDAKRSQMLVKIYYRKSLCVLKSTKECVKIETFVTLNACNTYFCFGYLTVTSFH